MEAPAVPSLLKFCVGGTNYMTTWTTISCRGTNFLTTLCENHYLGKLPCATIDGALFIDRSGLAFEYVLHYLRTGNITFGGG